VRPAVWEANRWTRSRLLLGISDHPAIIGGDDQLHLALASQSQSHVL
jgi:hypothetical protein